MDEQKGGLVRALGQQLEAMMRVRVRIPENMSVDRALLARELKKALTPEAPEDGWRLHAPEVPPLDAEAEPLDVGQLYSDLLAGAELPADHVTRECLAKSLSRVRECLAQEAPKLQRLDAERLKKWQQLQQDEAFQAAFARAFVNALLPNEPAPIRRAVARELSSR